MTNFDHLPEDVATFMDGVENSKRQADGLTLINTMKRITGFDPRMWGASLIGFDAYHYKYDSGREGDSFVTGFSPRKQQLVIYIMPGFSNYGPLLDKLGKHKKSVSCLYINKLEDIDMDVLEELITTAHKDMKAKHHSGPTRG